MPIGFMFIECVEGRQEELLRKVRQIPAVTYAYKLDKTYQIVAKIESDSVERFTAAISTIRSLGSILNTDTMVGFKN